MRSAFTWLLLLSCAPAWPQAPLTEAEALRLALTREEVADLARAAREEAEAAVLEARAWPNPTLDYSRERVRGAEGSTEQTWKVEQPVDLSGRRWLRGEAATRRVEVASAESARRRDELAADVRRRFHEALMREGRVAATERWIARFRAIESAVGRLRSGGEVSGYDHRRLARELASGQARLALEKAERDLAHERLAAVLPPAAAARTPGGKLLPEAAPPVAQAIEGLPARADLAALARRAEAADAERRAASRGWIPEVTVGVGTKAVDSALGRDSGVVASVSVPLPLFQRDQGGVKRAAAQGLAARAELRLELARAEGELRGLHRELSQLIAAADDYRANAAVPSQELLRIAEAAYRGGESTLLELLDAHRGSLEAEITALELEWKARETRIAYDLAAGNPIP